MHRCAKSFPRGWMLCAVISRSAATVQVVCSGGQQRKTSHVLRDAHAYMLISIPTATSTIFGAFQVMFPLFKLGASTRVFSHHRMFCVVGAFKHAYPPTELRSR
jgi:hypothetical protein